MVQLPVSHDASRFTVQSELGADGGLTADCAKRVCALVDEHGFAIIAGALTDAEADQGRAIIEDALSDPDRERSTFASETDTAFKRRDFCPLPSSPRVLDFASLLCRRTQKALVEYCGLTRSVLEITTLTSYEGSSHQYVHRDPPGVFCMFAAVDEVGADQGGTLFVPGTHNYHGAGRNHGGRAHELMRLYQLRCNTSVLLHNLRKLFAMRRAKPPQITREELRRRVFSPSAADNHQPNLVRFLSGRNEVFSLFRFGPRTLLRMLRRRREVREAYELVQATAAKGTILLYRSDMLHAGPDNRAAAPRYIFNINIGSACNNLQH
ncbi:MAG: phytanoyl-CoA dioxygenase family protein [Caulobacterales bacterium]|nr:phytanoyl-CoA dioxygenase family protein [Caulobacterales bacterium]